MQQTSSSFKAEFQAFLFKTNHKKILQPKIIVDILDETLIHTDKQRYEEYLEVIEDYLDKLKADINAKRWQESIEAVSKDSKLIKLLREDATEIEAGGIDDDIK